MNYSGLGEVQEKNLQDLDVWDRGKGGMEIRSRFLLWVSG